MKVYAPESKYTAQVGPYAYLSRARPEFEDR